MEVVREIAVDADPDDVWSALTEPAQLEEWFANDVELDPRPGGRGIFRWANGETREADVESVDEGSRLVLRFDDEGIVDLRILPAEQGASCRFGRRLLRGRPRSSCGPWPCVRSGRRSLLGPRRSEPQVRRPDTRGTGHGNADRARRRPPRHPTGSGEAPCGASRGWARRGDAVRARNPVRAHAGSACDRQRRGWKRSVTPGTSGSQRSSAWSRAAG